MNLETGEIITRQYVTPIPITPTVIRAVEALAEAQGVKSLKITGRNKVRILPADWVAGVHYVSNEDENENDDKDYEEESNEEESAEQNDVEEQEPITQGEIDELLTKDQ